MKKPVAIMIGSFVMWLLLTAPCGVQDVIAGLLVSALVAWTVKDIAPRSLRMWLNPVRYMWLLAYLLVLFYYIVKANIDVAFLVMHPAMPIRPGIVKVKTSLRHPQAITLLANSITLTPGTLTLHADEKGNLYVHCIVLGSSDPEELGAEIIGRFEPLLRKIFD